jgi:DnaJ-class molecular chaperone
MENSSCIQTLPILELPCEKCQGRGWYSFGGGEKETCPACEGAGYAPTEFGERVISLMRHNLRPMLRSVNDD